MERKIREFGFLLRKKCGVQGTDPALAAGAAVHCGSKSGDKVRTGGAMRMKMAKDPNSDANKNITAIPYGLPCGRH